ncbi:hypothetical protein NQ317_000044 [Molorchus minor]|uniref:Uncharacterized protein n=1 Tax=Molorchus minor TaxID=1323400 RepID=A0ABQ9IVK8_9CUCU|nr:hypothetical protein NQ317_000044 [Molorchus minor]
MKGNDGYYTSDVENCPNEVKFKAKAKLADKVLVWCAISEAGISAPYVGRVRGEAVDAELYTQRCLPKLLNFINTYHQNDDIIFGLTSLRAIMPGELENGWNKITLIMYQEKTTPPNVPQARPIEEFWSLLCRKVYDNGWEAQNEQQLQARIFRKIRKVDLNIVQRKMRQVLTKLRAIEDHRPLSLLINVYVRRLGGGFGAKISRNALISTAAALAAHKLRKPVKLWMPMEKNMSVIGKRSPMYVKYEVGVNEKGAIQYLDAEIYTDIGAGGNEAVLMTLFISNQVPNCYDVDTWKYTLYNVNTDTPANTWNRAPGTLEALGAIESIMEHIAHTINQDAADVKMENMDKKKHPKLVDFWQDMQTWGEIKPGKKAIEDYNKANRWKKRGMSLVPMSWKLEILTSYSVLVSIFHADGGVVISHSGIEIGQGINTKAAQVCAYKFGIPLEKVSVRPSYNVISPNALPTGSSLTSEAVCYGVIQACDTLLERLAPIRTALLNPKWEVLVNAAHLASVLLTASGYFRKNSPDSVTYHIYGVCATEVEVDILTGQHMILRVDILEDVGDSMSPLVDIGQVEGAFVMGIGYYTMEEIIFNDEGKVLTNRTWNYRVPGALDIPINFRIKFPENNPNPVGVLHSKAVGEPPMCLSCSLPLAIRHALASASKEADPSKTKLVSIRLRGEGTSTVQNTLLNTLNNYNQYVLS